MDVVLATGPAGGAGFTLETYNTWGTRSTRRLYLYGQGTSGLTFVNGTRTTTEESKNINYAEKILFSAKVNSSPASGPLTLGSYSDKSFFEKTRSLKFWYQTRNIVRKKGF